MLKKLASLLLSVLLCLSLLPNLAHAADGPEPSASPAQTEPAEPEVPVMPQAEEMPDDYSVDIG